MGPSFRDFHSRPGRRGFTLIELLVSMAVLVVLLALLTEMVQLVSSAWKMGAARSDNFNQTRVVLGLIERDIQGMVVRPDVAAFYDSAGNPALAFYTRFPGGANTNRNVSLVEYAVTSTGNPQLLRYDDGGLAYAAASPPEIQIMPTLATKLTDLPASPLSTTSHNSTAVPIVNGQNPDQAQVLENGVVALQIQFLRPDATLQSSFQFNYSTPTATTNTPTVVVSIAVLDNAAYQLAASANAFGKLSADLGATPPAGQTYAQYWNGRISSPTFEADLPVPVRASLHIFERRIAIPVPLLIVN